MGNETEINNYLDNISANLQNNTHYRRVIDISVFHPILYGGRYYIEGFKTDGDYEYQIARKYTTSTEGSINKVRSKNNGIWNTWRNLVIDFDLKTTYLTNQNLNDLTKQGTYFQNTNANATSDRNYPIQFAGFLEVIHGDDNWILQRYTEYITPAIYSRVYHNEWRDWKAIN